MRPQKCSHMPRIRESNDCVGRVTTQVYVSMYVCRSMYGTIDGTIYSMLPPKSISQAQDMHQKMKGISV